MVEHDEQTEQVLNSQFAEYLRNKGASPLDVIVETEPGAAQQVAEEIPGISGAELGTAGIIGGEFVAVSLPSEALPALTRLRNVVKVHYDQPVGIKEAGRGLPQLPFLRPENDPIGASISNAAFKLAKVEDKYVGEVGISEVEVPQVNATPLPPGNPAQALASGLDHAFGLGITGEEYIPTEESVRWIRDSNMLDAHDGADTKVAVIDTGHTPIPPANGGRSPHLESMVPGEPPQDMHGHGSWCTYTVAGKPSPSSWGTCQGVAEGAQYGHFKALNTFPGFGMTSWILKAMERARNWGADVISMSLGGDQQGPLDEDPYARFIRRRCKENAGDDEGSIFVVAAGNSGPDQWTIGSPGVSEKALTVGAWSMKDAAPSYYSSRGPQGKWYKDRGDDFREDRGSYGYAEFVKPDVTAPGGGRETKAKNDDEGELLHQTSVGWMEGLFDGLKDARGLMKGTSMATPHVAGLVTRLYDAGIVTTAADVKRVVRDRGDVRNYPRAAANANVTEQGKNISVGFGGVRESLFSP